MSDVFDAAEQQVTGGNTPMKRSAGAAERRAADLAHQRELTERDAELQAEKVARVRADREAKEAKADSRQALKELERAQETIDKIREFARPDEDQAPGWLAPEHVKGKLHRGIPTFVLSDMHFGEVIQAAELEGSNAYNRAIAEKRLENTFKGIVRVTRDYMQGMKFEGINLLALGDGLSGNIHEELKETNEYPLLVDFHHWSAKLEGFVQGLAEEFGKVHTVALPGNHGRNSLKSRFKGRAEDNFDWLMWSQIARSLRTDKRFTWNVPTSMDADLRVFDTRFKLTHGDQFHGGSGIAGIFSPLSLGQHRKQTREIGMSRLRGDTPTGFDWMVLGHFHQYFHGRGLIVNGSLKGYDEYAYGFNFAPEVPQQALWITTPEHGITQTAPIFSLDRKAEGW